MYWLTSSTFSIAYALTMKVLDKARGDPTPQIDSKGPMETVSKFLESELFFVRFFVVVNCVSVL